MKESDDLKLTENEKKYLIKFGKSMQRIYMNYITIGILFGLAIFGLVIGIRLKRQEGFLMSIIFTGLGVTLLVVSRKYQKLHNIISKMEKSINERSVERKS